MGSSFLAIRAESLAPLAMEPALKSRIYFWDLKRAALGSLVASTLDEFQDETGLLLTIEPVLTEEVTWLDMDLEG